MKTIHVRIPDSHYDRLQAIAIEHDRDFSWVLRYAVQTYLQTSQDAPPRTVTQRVLGIASHPLT